MSHFIKGLRRLIKHIIAFWKDTRYSHVDKSAHIHESVMIYNPDNIYMDADTNIDEGAIIMNTKAKFIMKKWSGAAFGLTVITGGHLSVPSMNFKQVTNEIKEQIDTAHQLDQDIVVDEDCWIGARSILLRGAHIGRGCIIGAGSVVRGSIPPYSIAAGNPAKIVGFRFKPDEILAHEQSLYDQEDRIPESVIRENYDKYFMSRLRDISKYMKIV